jgi:hypothetical protein
MAGYIAGLGLMTLGTFVEYWILFPLPHRGGSGSCVRGLSWMTVLLGALVLSVFTVAAGGYSCTHARCHGGSASYSCISCRPPSPSPSFTEVVLRCRSPA